MKFFWQFMQTVLGLIFRHPLVGVVIIPILQDGSIVLVRRRDSQQWALPGGMVDWGENVSSALHRELKEETGLEVVDLGRMVGVYSDPDRDPRLHSICVAIEAQVQGVFQIGDQREICEIQSFSPSQIPYDQLAHDHGRQLRDYWAGGTVIA